MNRKNKGFTLIELLAVIVILGLLMAIAIPSVTKYITQSRKKTVTTTIGNYVGALTNQVNDMEYTFTGANTIYAVPIECIALERGGTNPFGKWYQANNAYWAYVLVQYNDETSSYTYGFTFKDSAGYGMMPTATNKIDEKGSQISTNLSLTRPTNGTITNIATKDKWIGFDLEEDTNLVILEAESEGTSGNGQTTCTLSQKGDNYSDVEEEKKMRLSYLIREHNPLITASPTLTTSSNNTSDESGLYSSTDTNSGKPTYYFRGNVTNNYVSFAGFTWKIIRINEDGTIRLILNSAANNKPYGFNGKYNSYEKMYYSNSNAKIQVEDWYQIKIIDKGYDSYVATGKFCEQAKVKWLAACTSGNEIMVMRDQYIPNFKCETDGNGKGSLDLKVGLITYDEVIHAGGGNSDNTNYYLRFVPDCWTMSPAGFEISSYGWVNFSMGSIGRLYNGASNSLRPVINLNANVLVTGTGTSSDPYVVQTN